MIYNYGSINLDHLYHLARLPKPGETLTAARYELLLGGKGLNQSVAIAKAGGQVTHIGSLGPDAGSTRDQIQDLGVSTESIAEVPEASGHAIINLDADGENQIVIYGGANQANTLEHIEAALALAVPGDWFLVQNETNLIAQSIQAARSKGLKIAYSPAPFEAAVALQVLDQVDLIALNEHEAAELEKASGKPLSAWGQVLLTKGKAGAEFLIDGQAIHQKAMPAEVIDTTGAGDTFLGSFLAKLDAGFVYKQALHYASAAASLQIGKIGAAQAIPTQSSVDAFLRGQDL